MAYSYDPRQQNPGYNPPAWANPQQQQWTNPQPNPTPPPQPQFYNAPLIPQPRTVPCRVVNNPADITPSEIPMDGRVSLFLSSDNSYIMQTGYGIQNGITQMGIAQMQDTNAISRQLADCCCENRQGQADIKYAMATDTCAITTAINQVAQQIMQNDNANYRQLHDE